MSGAACKPFPADRPRRPRSLGMSEFDINRSIILPQALRVAVPPLVGNVLDISMEATTF